MGINPIKRLKKAPCIWELDHGYAGLYAGSFSTRTHTVFHIRTKIRGGIFKTQPILHGQEIMIPPGVFAHFPSGLTIIPPQDRESPGWDLINRMPMLQLKLLERKLDEANRIIEDMVGTDFNHMSPEQIKEDLQEIQDIFKHGNHAVSANQESTKVLAEPKVQV